MTRRQRQVSDRWGSSIVRAPQAAEATAWDGSSRWGGEASREWAASPAPAYGPPDADRDVRILRATDFGAGRARANDHAARPVREEAGPSPASAPEPAPASPAYDLDGMQRSIQWVTWAVEECSRAYTRINGRLGDIEQRLGALEAVADSPAGHANAPDDAPDDAPGSDVDAALEDLASRLAAYCTESARRIGAVEQAVRAHLAGREEQPSAAGSDVEGLYRELDHLYEALHVSGWPGGRR